MINRNSSIRVKTLFYLVLFSVFILLLLWGTQLLLSNYLYQKYQMNDMNKIAKEISDTDYEDLDEYLEKVVYNNSVCIQFIDEFHAKNKRNAVISTFLSFFHSCRWPESNRHGIAPEGF